MNSSNKTLRYALIGSTTWLSVCLTGWFTKPLAAQGGNAAVEKLAAENGLVGYDHSRQVQKKLLEFVSPIYKEPLVSSQLIVGLSEIDPSKENSPARKLAAERIASAAGASSQLDTTARLSELYMKQRALGQVTPGSRALGGAAKASAEATRLVAKGDLLEEQLRYEKKFAEVYLEQSKVRREFKLSRVKDINIDPVSAQTAFALNVLLDSIKPALGSAPINSLDPAYKEVFDKQLLRSSDIDEIMLELDNGTVALKFPASKGSSSVGQPPTAMRDPQLIPLVNQIEAKFDQLRQETPQKSILEITEELNQMIDALDAKSTEVIGTAPMNAKKGQVYYRTWKQAQEYRARVRSIVNRMALEGTTDVLRSPDGRYDIEKHGNRVVDLVKFVIDNGCKFAPAKAGDAVIYSHLQRSLLELNSILTD